MFAIRHAPFSIILFPFILGIIYAEFFKVNSTFLFIIGLIAIVGFGFSLLFKGLQRYSISQWFPTILFAIFIFSMGFFFHSQETIEEDNYQGFSGEIESEHLVRALDYSKKSTNSYNLPIEIITRESPRPKKAILFHRNDSLLVTPGDVLLVSGNVKKITTPQNPFAFDYQSYMKRKGIAFQLFAKLVQTLGEEDFSILSTMLKLRMRLLAIFGYYLTGDELGIASALVLGYKADLNDDLKSAYAGAGAMHVLAVSGLHVGLVYLFLSGLLSFMDKRRSTFLVKMIFVVLGILFYAALTGFSPSVTRAAVMFSLMAVGQMLRRHGSIYNIIFVSAFGMLAYDSNLLFDVSFQLSYVAVIGIIYLYPIFFELFEPANRLSHFLWSLVCLSLSAQLSTFPLALYYFNLFPTWFLLTNLIVVPAATLILPGGFLLIIAHFFGIGNGFGFVYSQLISLTNHVMFFIEDLPPGKYSTALSESQLWLLYAFLICSVLMIKIPKKILLYMSSFSLLILLSSFVREEKDQLDNIGFTVFSHKHIALEFHSAQKSVFMADSALLHDHKKRDYLLRSYYLKRGLKEFDYAEIHSDFSENFVKKKQYLFCFNDQLIYLHVPGEPIPDNVNYLVMTEVMNGVEDLLELKELKQVIILKSVRPWKESEWLRKLEMYRIPYWSIREKGAYTSF